MTRLFKLSESQRFVVLVFDALWRAHHTALTITQIESRGYPINNATLASLKKSGLIKQVDGQGWCITGAGKVCAELLQENLLLKHDGRSEALIAKFDVEGGS